MIFVLFLFGPPQVNRAPFFSPKKHKKRKSLATMASGSIVKKEVGENHDVLLFGVNNSVKGDLAPQHPIQATVHKVPVAASPLLAPSKTLTR